MQDQQCESVRRTSRSQEAADAYCSALAENYRGSQGGNADWRLALERAQHATSLDSDIVDAHFLVGLNYINLGESGRIDWREATREARAALNQMLALDPDNVEAVGLRGRIEHLEMNYPASEMSFRDALARDPLNPRVGAIHGRLATVMAAQNRLGESIEHFRRGLRVDESNAIFYTAYANVLWSTGEYRDALRVADAGLELINGGFAYAVLVTVKVAALDALSERARANRLLDEALDKFPPELKPVLAVPLGLLGRDQEVRQLIAAMQQRYKHPPILMMAEAFAVLGDELAFDWIDKGIERHIARITNKVRWSPAYSRLRTDPRWIDVMARLESEEAKGTAATGPDS